ncbi:type VI secretion system baseplate subunit TssG [Campylobacter coli]|uniref:type VI secretion system baseplate subunit TssG n=1 Tax=Campylobacter coli TaxID=195 RepID=UPI003CE7A030
MNNFASYDFYKLLSKLLETYNKNEIFLRTNKELKHPHREIESVNINMDTFNQELAVQIMTNFMGLHGNTSQLPSYMLDKLSRNEDGNEGWTLFFDFFNNYILWIFFESLSIRNYPRSFKSDFTDSISYILFKMLGINDSKIAKKYLPFAPLLLSLRKPKNYIERVLCSNFDLHNRLHILENLPHQILIASSQINKLGIKNNILGKNCILGTKFLSFQNKIAIYIHDIDYLAAIEYLPGRNKYQDLKDSITFLTNSEFCVDLYLKINLSEKMIVKLGDESVAKLGWGTILGKAKKDYLIMRVDLCK